MQTQTHTYMVYTGVAPYDNDGLSPNEIKENQYLF